METLAEEAARMRRPAVVVGGERPAGLARDAEMSKVAAFRGVTGERPALRRRLGGRCLDRDLAAALVDKAIGPDATAGKIVRGKLPHRQAPGKTGGERVRRIMVLMAALEGRHPQRPGAELPDRRLDRRRRIAQIGA